MRERFPLHNSVLPGKVYAIRDAQWNIVGEMTADTAVEALHEACREWGEHCRSATPSTVVMAGVKKMRYSI